MWAGAQIFIRGLYSPSHFHFAAVAMHFGTQQQATGAAHSADASAMLPITGFIISLSQRNREQMDSSNSTNALQMSSYMVA